MSVSFVFGKPGGGKSLYAFHKIIGELTRGNRPVITNLPVRPDALNEWLQREGYSVDLHSRLKIIDTDELPQWWRFRGRGADGEWVELPHAIEYAKNETPPKGAPQRDSTDFRTSPGPVFYVLDEIHTCFNARSWMNTGLAAIWYLSQHRKLGDDVIMISQTPGQVDKQLRSMSQDWVQLTNLCKMKMGYLFTLPQRILWRAYSNQPTAGEPILATGILKIDSPGWADCYNTAQGNSICGQSNADIGQRAKGIPWYVAGILPFILAFLIWELPGSLTWGIRKVTGAPMAQLPASKLATPIPPPLPPPVPVRTPDPTPPPSPNRTETAIASIPRPDPEIECTGWVRIGDQITAYLSDGSSARMGDGLTSLTRREVVVDGVTYRIRTPYGKP